MPNERRTLLSLLRAYQKNKANLITNQRAYTWGWINDILSGIYCRRADQLMAKNRSLVGVVARLQIEQEICKSLEKITKEPWVRYNGGIRAYAFYPRKMLKSYMNYNKTLVWIFSDTYEEYKDAGWIRWSDEAKMWCYKDCFVEIKHWNGQMTEKKMVTVFHDSNGKTHQYCPVCDSHWTPSSMRKDEDTDELFCHPCFQARKNVPNAPHNKDNIYGAYHSHKNWIFKIQRLKKEKTLPIGVELEVQSKDGRTANAAPLNCWQIYTKQRDINPDWHNLYFERDGSLMEGGFEIISNPMTLDFHKEFWGQMLPIIRSVATGWNTGDKDYGIHLTFSRQFWTDFQLARFLKFIETPANQHFVICLAQRVTNYGGGYVAGEGKNLKRVCRVDHGKIINSERNQSVNIKNARFVEVRMFRSTLNQTSFMKNLEFIDAMWHWCRSTSYSVSFVDFIAWIKTDDNRQLRYENLLTYLNKDKFAIKGAHTLKNDWKTLVMNRVNKQGDLFSDLLPSEQVEEERG